MSAQGGGSTVEPVCPRHPDRISYVSCQRCGRPACPSCQTPAPVGVICVDCARDAQKQARPVVNRLGFTSAFGKPIVTYTLIALNVLAFIYGYLVVGKELWWADWGLIPALNGELGGAGEEWYRWVTSGFLHFSIWHIGMNMLVLWQFGSQLEPILGRARFTILYLLSLLGGSLGVELLASSGVHGGASGAIFGLFAAYAVVLYKLKLNYQQVVTTAVLWIGLGFIVPGISWQAHAGGAVVGALVMFAMLHWVDARQRSRR